MFTTKKDTIVSLLLAATVKILETFASRMLYKFANIIDIKFKFIVHIILKWLYMFCIS